METREKEHLLALKVMRLTRPSLYATHPVASDSRYFPCDLINSAIKSDIGSPRKLEYFGSGNLLMLPQSFGCLIKFFRNIYLGETFSCYMSVHNDSQQIVSNVNVQADLQIGMQKIVLSGHRGNYSTVSQLKPDESVDDVIHHEVKEIGTHILACTVSYTNLNNEKMHFRKFFKFQVGKPLDVKTKFFNTASDDVFLEAPLQNITYAPMCLEKVALEPSSNFVSRQINLIGLTNEDDSVFGEVNCLNPLDSRQYLFCLTPKPENQTNMKLKGVTSIGKLDIVWRTNMGERGRLQTSQLEIMAPGYGEIRLVVKEIPSIVTLEKPFPLTIRITNTCERTLDLIFSLHNKFSNGIVWQGISGQKLSKIEKGTYVELHLEAVAVKTGIQLISGVKVKELFLKRLYDFDEIAPVYVTPFPIST